MLPYAFCVLLTVTVISAESVNKERTNIMTARCRAHCLSKFSVDGLNDNCFGNPECFMCWDTCRMFYINFKVWGPMCYNKHLCFPGCQESCTFYHSQLNANIEVVVSPDNFTQPLKYRHWPENDTIQLEWSRPVTVSKGDGSGSSGLEEPLVYVVTLQDQLSGFLQEITQTFYLNATVQRSLLKSSTLIQLTAYSFNGKVAYLEKRCAEFSGGINLKNDCTQNRCSDGTYIADSITHREQEDVSVDVEYASWKPTLLSLQCSMEDIYGVDAHVTWPHIPQAKKIKYNVEWSRVENDVNVTTSIATLDNVATLTVWPNNIYQVYVHAFINEFRRTSVTTSKILTVDTTSSTFERRDFQCSRVIYNVTLIFVLIFSIASATILIIMYLRIAGLKPS